MIFAQSICVMFSIKFFPKVLAYRLKKLLPSMITEHQPAFTKDRLIIDNIMIAFETLHYMKSHNSGRPRFMALKLDMSKAYDRVEWNFLENIMRKMGFNEQWIGLVMVCVRSVTYSILVNGEPKGMIQPSRGIWQRDPFSLFLFILLCIERLHGLISNAANSGNIEGFSLCRRGSKLTHLLFADESLLFCRATIDECDKVLNILETYEMASGQKVNENKTALFFSKSTSEQICQAIKEKLGL